MTDIDINDMNNIGILDPEGKNKNPLTGKDYSDEYKKWGEIWSTFPAYENAREIIQDINNHQVLLVISGTGSGKTVLLPKYVAHTLKYQKKIAITLPKQVITQSTAEFAAKTLDVKLGEEVGYKYRGSPREHMSNKTKLLYATDGTIVAKLINDPYLKEFDAVLVDEAHERKVQIDFLLYLLRETLKLRPEFKLIIMSATIDEKIFKNYFDGFKYKNINISGKANYPIESIFLKEKLTYNEVMEKGFDILINILEKDDVKKKGAHDIMFFITSSNEAFDLCKRLNNYIETIEQKKCKITCDGNVYCVEVYSGMPSMQQELAQHKDKYKESGVYVRKLVMATPVAESSLTIDGIKFVIDSGYELHGSYDPKHRARRLERELITHAQAKQRMGRAGRTESGICYHLYTKADFDKNMIRFPLPDIRTSDVSDICLNLLGFKNIPDISTLLNILTQFIEPPKENYIKAGLMDLMNNNIIANEKLTELGKVIVNLRMSNYQNAIALIYSVIYDCSEDMSKIIAMIDATNMNMGKLINSPAQILEKNETLKEDEQKFKQKLKELNAKFDNNIKKFKHKYGDHLSLLNIYNEYIKVKDNELKLKEWSKEHFLKDRVLAKADRYRRTILKNINASKIYANQQKKNDDIVKLNVHDRLLICLAFGLKSNTAVKTKDNSYRTQYAKDMDIKINKTSFLSDDNPKNIFYSELFISMGSNNVNLVSVINDKIIKILT